MLSETIDHHRDFPFLLPTAAESRGAYRRIDHLGVNVSTVLTEQV